MPDNRIKILEFIIGFLLLLFLQNVEANGEELTMVKTGKNVLVTNVDALDQAEKAEVEGNYGKAIELYNTLIAVYEKKLGAEHPDTIDVLTRKFKTVFNSHKWEEALPLAWKIYRLQEKIHGKLHGATVDALVQLAHTYFGKGKHAKAEELFKAAYRLSKSLSGKNDPQTVLVLFLLAHVYRVQGEAHPEKLDLALKYYRKVYEVWSKHPEAGQEHEMTLQALKHIGDVLGMQNKLGEAAEKFQKVLQTRRKTLGDAHPLTKEIKSLLIRTLTGAGKIGQANKIIKQIRSDQDSNSDSDSDYADSLFFLLFETADALAAKEKYAEAVEMLTNMYEHKDLNPKLSPKTLFNVLEHLIKYNIDSGDFNQAKKWANVVIDLLNDPSDPNVKVISQEDGEYMTLLHLHAIEAFIYIYAHEPNQQNDEKIDYYFKTAHEVTKVQGQGQDQGQLDSITIREKLFSITTKVALFKEEIGKKLEAVQIFSDFVTQNPHQIGNESLMAVHTMMQIAIGIDDYKLVENLALKFLSHDHDLEDDQSAEAKEKLKHTATLTELVAEYLLGHAELFFTKENYKESFSLHKTVEEIWPKSWTGDDEKNREFLREISKTALALGKFDQALFYMEKETTVLKNKLTTQPRMDEQEREKIVQMIQESERLQEKIKGALKAKSEL